MWLNFCSKFEMNISGLNRDITYTISVNPRRGLFFFDSEFRPVPLEQHLIGIKGKPGSIQANTGMDRTCYEKVCVASLSILSE
jgi:hypothetical protein